MKSHIAIVVISVFVAIALSLLFIPNEKEIALINYKGQNYDTAKQIFTQYFEAGDWSVSSVMPLIQIHSHSGDVLAAIAVLERFIELNPDHLDALTLIGTSSRSCREAVSSATDPTSMTGRPTCVSIPVKAPSPISAATQP